MRFILHAVVGCLIVYAYLESVVSNNGDNNNRGGRHVKLSRDQFWTLLRENSGPTFGLKCVLRVTFGYKDGCLDPVCNTALISFCVVDIHRWCID